MATKAGTSMGESLVRRYRTFVVGLFVMCALFIVVVLFVFSLMKSEIFQKWNRLYVVYDQTYGLSSSNAVTISGMVVGHVEKVNLDRMGRVVVQFKINRGYDSLVKKDAIALLAQKNLVVGDWEIAITGGTQGSPVASDGDTLKSNYSFRIDRVTEQVTGMVTEVDGIIKTIAGGKGTVGRLLVEDTLVTQVQAILRNVNALAVQSSKMMRQADTLLGSLNRIGATGITLADTLKAVVGFVQNSLGDVKTILENARSASGDVAPMMGQVQDNLNQAEIMMRGLQKNWLVRGMTGTPEDKILKNDP